jgi:uncharacterized membrane protein YfcA
LDSILLAITALVAGTFIGTVGVGGILLIPAFIFFAGINTHEASATALFTFLFTGILGSPQELSCQHDQRKGDYKATQRAQAC